jgi:hypothetical protein
VYTLPSLLFRARVILCAVRKGWPTRPWFVLHFLFVCWRHRGPVGDASVISRRIDALSKGLTAIRHSNPDRALYSVRLSPVVRGLSDYVTFGWEFRIELGTVVHGERGTVDQFDPVRTPYSVSSYRPVYPSRSGWSSGFKDPFGHRNIA